MNGNCMSHTVKCEVKPATSDNMLETALCCVSSTLLDFMYCCTSMMSLMPRVC